MNTTHTNNVKWSRDGSWLTAAVNGHKLSIGACMSGKRYTGTWTVLMDGQYVTQTSGRDGAKDAAYRAAGLEVVTPTPQQAGPATPAEWAKFREIIQGMITAETDHAVKSKLVKVLADNAHR